MTTTPDPASAATLRHAGPHDAAALRDLEREANLVALAHVFPPEQHPYPDAAVLARWERVLAEPGVTVLLGEDGAGATCALAHDAEVVRHLAVRPDRWGTGLAGLLVGRATETIAAGGQRPRLWCLVANERARGLYEHLGWRASGRTRPAEWPPYPEEMEYVREVADGV